MNDPAPSDFERQKWEAEYQLKRDELALKARELDIRERESQRARWSNPLVLAILGAALAGVGNAVATYLSGKQQRDLETIKAESQLILEVTKLADPDKAAANLGFLMQMNLISDQARRLAIANYLETRKPGSGFSIAP